MVADAPACCEPTIDYVVSKVARFPFDKFAEAANELGTQMKATGEVMSIGRTFEESLLKAIRSLEIGACHLFKPKFLKMSDAELFKYIAKFPDDHLLAIAQLIRNGVDIRLIYDITKIDMLFLEKICNIVRMEQALKAAPGNAELLLEAKKLGFSDKYLGQLWGRSEKEMVEFRWEKDIRPVYKFIYS